MSLPHCFPFALVVKEGRIMGEKSWVVNIKEKLGKLDESQETQIWTKHSIYKVPTHITDLKPKAYKPQVVSFGPYHHGEEQLKPMEQHKQRALLHFLKRTRKPIEDYVTAVEAVVTLLQDSYERLDEVWKDRNRFLELMILDGCFMLEVLRTATGDLKSYADNDPLFSDHGKLHMVPYIRRDMLMIENQLPQLVLEKLMTVESGNNQNVDTTIHKVVMSFLSPHTPPPSNMTVGLHALDIFRKSMLLCSSCPKSRDPNPQGTGEIVRSATELNEAGIRLKTSNTNSLQDITFRSGVLRLPMITVDDATESTFLNLMAFERLHVGAGNEVTSYVFFMDNIIDSNRDVSLLHSKGIIQNALGSDKAVAKLFNELSKDVTLDPNSSLDAVHKEVHEYCKKKWNEWRANLIHTYFRSPWALLSLVAAIFLVALTIAQTVYTIYPFYRTSDSPSPPIGPPPTSHPH